MIEKVLAIETSCDDTSAAVVGHDGWVHALSSVNQDLEHGIFGGVVPEIACRNHTHRLLPLVDEVLAKAGFGLNDLGRQNFGLAVTSRPGLIGPLMVGVVTAKTLALAWDLPWIAVNHLEGHLLAPFLRDDQYQPAVECEFPLLALIVSGGHTSLIRSNDLGVYEVLGRTVDDAAGEAFDKFAKMVGLGFPGGAKLDRLARDGDKTRFQFPRAMLRDRPFDFSFSGLKTFAANLVAGLQSDERERALADLCASYQEAVVDVLMAKLEAAQKRTQITRIVISGGVSANSRLRERAEQWARAANLTLLIPPLRYCTDNAAMIGLAGVRRLARGERSDQRIGPSPSSLAGDFQDSL